MRQQRVDGLRSGAIGAGVCMDGRARVLRHILHSAARQAAA